MQILEADESGLVVRLSRGESVSIAGGLLMAAMVQRECGVGSEPERAMLAAVAQRLLFCGLAGEVGERDRPERSSGGWWGWLRRWIGGRVRDRKP